MAESVLSPPSATALLWILSRARLLGSLPRGPLKSLKPPHTMAAWPSSFQQAETQWQQRPQWNLLKQGTKGPHQPVCDPPHLPGFIPCPRPEYPEPCRKHSPHEEIREDTLLFQPGLPSSRGRKQQWWGWVQVSRHVRPRGSL